MQDIKQNLADAIRKSRTELGLSQEKLAEILGFDSRTILNIENGRGNPKFEKLYPLVRHLNISADRIFYPESVTPQPNLQKLSVDAGFSCPNRDGTIGKGGCTFCDNGAFTPSYCMPSKT